MTSGVLVARRNVRSPFWKDFGNTKAISWEAGSNVMIQPMNSAEKTAPGWLFIQQNYARINRPTYEQCQVS